MSRALPSLAAARLEALVIGASTGAVDALGVLLPALALSLPIAIVVHVPASPSLLPELFAPRCRQAVREPLDKERIARDTIYFAPPGYHLLVERDRSFSLSLERPVLFSRPSIDVLFETAADAFGERLGAVVLTGASSDGAAGARAVRDAGGVVIVQDPRDAVAAEMPRSALALTQPTFVGSLEEIGRLLASIEMNQS